MITPIRGRKQDSGAISNLQDIGLEMITPIRGRKQSGDPVNPTTVIGTIRNDNPDKGMETPYQT